MRWLCLCVPVLALLAPAAAQVRLADPAALDPVDSDLAVALKSSGSLERAAGLLNAKVALPQAVTLRYASCVDPNAWYQPEQGEVRVCLSLARHLANLLAAQVEDEAQMLEALDGALRFIALHELGHALVDKLHLPVTGREEDAVDQFAVWLLLGDGDSAGVLSAASVFGSAITGAEDAAAAHSLDRQRYFNMLCWVYGSDPRWRDSLLADWALPSERAAGCAEEYAQLGRSWQRLLAAHAPGKAQQPAAPKVTPRNDDEAAQVESRGAAAPVSTSNEKGEAAAVETDDTGQDAAAPPRRTGPIPE